MTRGRLCAAHSRLDCFSRRGSLGQPLFEIGDVLFSFETDKSSIDYTAEAEGEVLALLCEEGDEVPVLSTVAVLGKKGEDISAFTAGASAPAADTSNFRLTFAAIPAAAWTPNGSI